MTTFSVPSSALRFTRVNHKNFFHFTIIQIVQITNGSFSAMNQVNDYSARSRPRNKLML